MQEAKLFINGKSQAVRLPKAFRFEGDAVLIKRQGEGVLLLPKKSDPWEIAIQSLEEFSEDLQLEREQDMPQDRTPLLNQKAAERQKRGSTRSSRHK